MMHDVVTGAPVKDSITVDPKILSKYEVEFIGLLKKAGCGLVHYFEQTFDTMRQNNKPFTLQIAGLDIPKYGLNFPNLLFVKSPALGMHRFTVLDEDEVGEICGILKWPVPKEPVTIQDIFGDFIRDSLKKKPREAFAIWESIGGSLPAPEKRDQIRKDDFSIQYTPIGDRSRLPRFWVSLMRTLGMQSVVARFLPKKPDVLAITPRSFRREPVVPAAPNLPLGRGARMEPLVISDRVKKVAAERRTSKPKGGFWSGLVTGTAVGVGVGLAGLAALVYVSHTDIASDGSTSAPADGGALALSSTFDAAVAPAAQAQPGPFTAESDVKPVNLSVVSPKTAPTALASTGAEHNNLFEVPTMDANPVAVAPLPLVASQVPANFFDVSAEEPNALLNVFAETDSPSRPPAAPDNLFAPSPGEAPVAKSLTDVAASPFLLEAFSGSFDDLKTSTYTVKPGDTLYDIIKAQYGVNDDADPAEALRIAKMLVNANPDAFVRGDMNLIKASVTLKLPIDVKSNLFAELDLDAEPKPFNIFAPPESR